jgi:dihydroorotase
VIALLSTQPAQLLHLAGRGTLAVGAWADLALFAPQEKWTYRAAEGKSKARNSPFDGWTLPGRVHLTISEGRIVYDARSKT